MERDDLSLLLKPVVSKVCMQTFTSKKVGKGLAHLRHLYQHYRHTCPMDTYVKILTAIYIIKYAKITYMRIFLQNKCK